MGRKGLTGKMKTNKKGPETLRNNKKALLRIADLKTRLSDAIMVEHDKIANNPKGQSVRQNRSNYNNIDRYQFGLRLLNYLPANLKTNVKETANKAVNIGEVGEILVKYLQENNRRVLRTSVQGTKDLNRRAKHEVKVVSKTTRSNNWNAGHGALVIMQGDADIKEGIYWLNRDELSVEFKNGDRLDHRKMKQIIHDYEIPCIKELG